jgi:hypothetical protein
MKKNLDPKEWAKDFQEFMSVEGEEPPRNLSNQILSKIHGSLNPSQIKVFSKLLLIHLIVGTITLLFCPQFGLSPLGSMGLMGLLMKFGDYVCMLGCGAVFLGGTSLTAALILRPEEIRVLRDHRILQLSVLCLVSAAVFFILGYSIQLNLTLTWLIGALFSGVLLLELAWKMRRQLIFS